MLICQLKYWTNDELKLMNIIMIQKGTFGIFVSVTKPNFHKKKLVSHIDNSSATI